jgi:hypothetical protein
VPAAEFDKYFKNADDLKSQAGSWIAGQEDLKNLKIVFSDQVLKFHADAAMDRHGDASSVLHIDPDDRDFLNLCRFAIEKKLDAIAIYGRSDRQNTIGEFTGYRNIKEFSDNNKFIRIFVKE